MKLVILAFILVFISACLTPNLPYELKQESARSVRRFFDLDHNGTLNRHELALLQTKIRFDWELADSKSKQSFDWNKDHMLSPPEWERYKNATREEKLVFKKRFKARQKAIKIHSD